MDLYINRTELIRGLQRVQGIVERRTTNLALAHVLMSADGDTLRLTATDTMLTLIADYPARVEAAGKLSVDAQTIFQISKALSDSTVHLKVVKGNRLRLTCGRAEYNIVAMSADEFPPISDQDKQNALEVSSAGLKGVIEETIFSISADDNRYGLNGAHLECIGSDDGGSDQFLRLVTTDGSRLSWSQTTFSGNFAMGRSMLVPRKALGEIRKICDIGGENWKISFGERSATFETEDIILMVRLIEGEFPDYRQVVPSRSRRKVVLDRSLFVDALRHVAIMASDRNHSVRFGLEEDRVVLMAQNIESGDVREEIPAEVEGEALETGFNVRYFQDLLSVSKEDKLTLELGDALDPCLVRIGDRQDCLFVVMPMRLD